MQAIDLNRQFKCPNCDCILLNINDELAQHPNYGFDAKTKAQCVNVGKYFQRPLADLTEVAFARASQ